MKTSVYLFLLLAGSALCAQSGNDTVSLLLDFPIVDLPYQSHASETTGNFLKAYGNPSMKQSLAMSTNLYSTAHWGIKELIKTKSEFTDILFSNVAAASFDLITLYTPLGYGWLHEEYHRAVMTIHRINSFNDMNTFPFGSKEISVRKVSDENLIRLSDNHTKDFTRLMVASNEAQYHQIQTLQKNDFFYSQGLPHIPLYWISSMTNIIYVNQSASDSFDELVDETNAADGTDIDKRDFTGPDFTAWADALYFPENPYTDRGVHPSGIGVNRYVKPTRLSTEARAYLEKQGNLQWLNLLSPHLFGFPRIKIVSNQKGDYYGSFAIRHVMTSFGNDISLDLFLQSPNNNLFFTLHSYNNLNKTFGGIEASIIDEPLLLDKIRVSVRGLIWVQPENHSFTTENGSVGGLFSIRTYYSFGAFYPYIELEGKTNGWVMGNVFLDKNVSLTVGLSVRII